MKAPRDLRFAVALAEAGRLWWHNLPSFGLIAMVMAIPLALVELVSHRLHTATHVGLALVFVLAGLTVAAFSEAFCAGLAEHVLHRDRIGRGRLPLWRLARLLPLLRLFALAIIVGTAVAVGAILLLVPGLVAYAWLAVAAPVASFEQIGAIAALRRSVALVRGRFWPVAALTTVTFVPVTAADTLGSVMRTRHSPVWLAIAVEAVSEAAVISLTASVVVVVYHALRDRPAPASR